MLNKLDKGPSKKIQLEGVPSNVNEEPISRSVYYFLSKHSIVEKITQIRYLGGCSNHALKVDIETGAGINKSLLIRLPGSHSEVLVNRQSGEIFETEYNLLERIRLMCYTLQDVNGEKINFFSYQKGQSKANISQILSQLDCLEKFFNAFGAIKKAPCHNDHAPFNFMVAPTNTKEKAYDIQIIDWEYSGMNDPLCELAYIANENGYQTRDEILRLLQDCYQGEILPSDELQEKANRALFYLPLIDLKVAIWSVLQVHLCNQSQYLEELRTGRGPERYVKYLEKIESPDYKALIDLLNTRLNQSVMSYSFFAK